MPRITNVEKAAIWVVQAEKALEDYKSTPEYETAMQYRRDVKAAYEDEELARSAVSETEEAVAVRLGIQSRDRNRSVWSPAFIAEVKRVFETEEREDLPGFKYSPFYNVARKVADELTSKDAGVQRVRASWEAAHDRVTNLVYARRPRPDEELFRLERQFDQATNELQDAKNKAESRTAYRESKMEERYDPQVVADKERKKRAAAKVTAYMELDVGLPEGFVWKVA